MAEKGSDVVFSFVGDTTQLEQAAQRADAAIQGTAEGATKGGDKIDKSLKSATKSVDETEGSMSDIADTTERAGHDFKETADAIGETNTRSQQLRGIMDRINPQMGEAVGIFGELTDVAEALAVSFGVSLAAFGALAAAAAAGVAAWQTYKWHQTIVKKETQELGGTIHGLSTSLDDLEQNIRDGGAAWNEFKIGLRDVGLEVDVLTGEITEQELATFQATDAARRALLPVLTAQAQLMDKAEKAVRDNQLAFDDYTKAYREGKTDIMPDREIVKRLQKQLSTAKDQLQIEEEIFEGMRKKRKEYDELIATSARLAKEEREREEAYAAAEARVAKLNDDFIEANEHRREAAEAAKMAEKEREDALTAAMDSMNAMREEALEVELSAMEEIEEARQKELGDLREIFGQAVALAELGTQARIDAEQRFADAALAIDKKYNEETRALREESAAEQAEANTRGIKRNLEALQDALEEAESHIEAFETLITSEFTGNVISAAETVSSSMGEIIGAEFDERMDLAQKLQDRLSEFGDKMTDEEKEQLKERIAAAKEATRDIAKAQKAFALFDVLIKTAQGIAAVWAEFGAFPPVAAGLTAVVAGAGAAQTAVIAKQKVEFHRGGVVDAALLDGESVLNRRATASLGEEGVNALNQMGRMPPPSITFRIGRHEAREIVRTDVRAQGLITQEIGRASRTTGSAGVSTLPVQA